MTHHKLSFEAHLIVGLGYNGELVLGNRDSRRYLHKMQHDGKEYKETWAKELRDGMEYHCYKQMSSQGYIFLQSGKNETTVCYDESLTKNTELYLQGVVYDSISDEVFYAQEPLDDCKISVHKIVMEGTSASSFPASAPQKLQLGPHRIKKLKPPSPHAWQWALSVCKTMVGYVVVESNTSSMDIFDQDGRKYFALKLNFIVAISVKK